MNVELSRDELCKLLDVIQLCYEAEVPQCLNRVFDQLGNLLPVEAGIFGLLTQCREDGQIRLLSLMTHKYSDRDLQQYAQRPIAKNPVVMRALLDTQPFELSSVQTGATMWPELSCGGNGLACGISGLREDTRTVISISFGQHRLHSRHYTVMQHVAPHLHEAFKRVCLSDRQDCPQIPDLTQREVEVLRWLRDGKRTSDIGRIMSISERTVKFHISNLCTKLGAANRAHAVANAMRLGVL